MSVTDDVTSPRLRSIPGITVTYGVVEPGGYARGGVPMLQAQNILRGRLASDPTMRIDEAVHLQNRRTWLREGDLVVVLVGRVGDAALVTAEHEGWNAARSVGVIRCTDPSDQATSTVEWLRYWFKSPSMRRWFAREARGFAQPTIGVRAIANLRVPLPAAADRQRWLDVLAQVEERALASLDLSRAATDTADALFAQLRMAGGALPAFIGDVCEARAGGGRAHRSTVVDAADTEESGRSGVQVATADVLNAEFPYWWNRMTGTPDRAWTEPGQLLIATRKGASGIVLDASGDAEAARGTLSVRADGAEEQWWLLHELRARPADIALAAQGASARELSARAFSSLPLAWPTARVRSEFAELASALHQRAILALEDHDDMQGLVGLLIERALRVSPAPDEGLSR